MTRTQYKGSIYVRSASRGITYLWKWDGRRYVIESVIENPQDANILGLPEVNFRISTKDLESLGFGEEEMR